MVRPELQVEMLPVIIIIITIIIIIVTIITCQPGWAGPRPRCETGHTRCSYLR